MIRLPQTILLWLLKAYKWMFSPLLPPSCRYIPTCSEYAMEAVERYGVLRGGMKATWRVLPSVRNGWARSGRSRKSRPQDAPVARAQHIFGIG
jgi:uncharacterized protein